jgi:hypothetical protein
LSCQGLLLHRPVPDVTVKLICTPHTKDMGGGCIAELPAHCTLQQRGGGGGGGGGGGPAKVVERVVEVESDVDAIREQLRKELEDKMKQVWGLRGRRRGMCAPH